MALLGLRVALPFIGLWEERVCERERKKDREGGRRRRWKSVERKKKERKTKMIKNKNRGKKIPKDPSSLSTHAQTRAVISFSFRLDVAHGACMGVWERRNIKWKKWKEKK